MRLMVLLLFVSLSSFAHALQPAVTQPIPVHELADFHSYPEQVKQLILAAEKLSKRKLTYEYGSANPNHRGMDCSGTVYYLLNQLGIQDVPRSSDQIYLWARAGGHFHRVIFQHLNSPEFWHLRPGDLLFWEGTYPVKRAVPITHVMIYLGRNTHNQPLMFGSSDGRTYKHQTMWGVSVFDFNLFCGRKARFVGYGCIPGLSCGS